MKQLQHGMTANMDNAQFTDTVPNTSYKIIQDKNGFCYGIDAVLLADFASIKPGNNVIDLCSGNGIVPLLLCGKCGSASYTGVEIQDYVCKMAAESIKLNSLDNIKMINADLKDIKNVLKGNSYDVLTINPPYMKNEGRVNPDYSKAVARHEVMCSIYDIAKSSSYLLKDGASLYMIHRPFRLTEIMDALKASKLECKEIRFVYPDNDSESSMVLIHAVKNAKPFARVQKPLYIYQAKGIYSAEVQRIYGKNNQN